MKTHRLPRSLVCLLAACFSSAFCLMGQAQAPEGSNNPEQVDPYEWVTESYSFPCFELLRGFASEDRGELRHPFLPPADAGDEQLLNYVKQSNSITSHFLDMQGMSLPEGVVVLFDPDSLTLTARAPRLIQGSISFLADTYQQSTEKYLVLEASILQSPADAVIEAVEQAAGMIDHSPLKEKLQGIAETRTVFFGKGECRSGQRTAITDNREIIYPADLELESAQTASFTSETDRWGTSFEFDAVIGADDVKVDLLYSVRRDYAEPEFVEQTVNRLDNTEVTMPVISRSFARTTSSTTVHSGHAILAAVYRTSCST